MECIEASVILVLGIAPEGADKETLIDILTTFFEEYETDDGSKITRDEVKRSIESPTYFPGCWRIKENNVSLTMEGEDKYRKIRYYIEHGGESKNLFKSSIRLVRVFYLFLLHFQGAC